MMRDGTYRHSVFSLQPYCSIFHDISEKRLCYSSLADGTLLLVLSSKFKSQLIYHKRHHCRKVFIVFLAEKDECRISQFFLLEVCVYVSI